MSPLAVRSNRMRGIPVTAAAAESTSGPDLPLVAAVALGLAAVHVYVRRLRFLGRIPRSRWLSFAGGTAVAYVFVHLLPELGAGAAAVAKNDGIFAAFLERHVYFVALAGFVTFYGVEQFARKRTAADEGRNDDHSGGDVGEDDESSASSVGIFWAHIGSFAAYNVLIGFSLHHRETALGLALFATAIGLHFAVNDFGLRDHHERRYDRVGRWPLAVAVLAGAAAGSVVPLGEAAFGVLLAFVGGSVILNVIKEELPEDRESRFGAFVVGAIVYTALLFAL